MRPSGLLHPVALVALAVGLANTWYLQEHYPGWITGKLSDVSGVLLCPLVLAALVGVGLPRHLYPRVVDGCIVATAIAFTLVKLWDPANQIAERVLELINRSNSTKLALDPTDLVALPMLGVARWCYRTSAARATRRSDRRPGGLSRGRDR